MKIGLILLLMAATLSVPAQTKKYGIKSAIVTFEQVTETGKKKSTNKVIVSFDDYGVKECRETYEGDTLKDVFFSDGKMLYVMVPAEKSVHEIGPAFRGTEARFDWNEVPQENKKSGSARKRPGIVIAGRECESFQVEGPEEMNIFGGWKNIMLLASTESKWMKSTLRAVKVEENAKVPPEKFKIPANYSVKKL